MSKPSTFSQTYPWNSVCQRSECETVARNIMIILSKTGDEWRELSWDEYKKERIEKGKGFSEAERRYFDDVIRYCRTQETAALFSPSWKEASDEA